MKKSILLIVSLLIGIQSFGQIKISESGSGNVNNNDCIFASDRYARVVFADSVYLFKVRDIQTGTYMSINLGKTQDDALSSLQTIADWIKSAKKKAYITINQDGVDITFYKYASYAVMVSYGDAAYCEDTNKSYVLATSAGHDTNYEIPFGYVANSLINKAIDNLRQTGE